MHMLSDNGTEIFIISQDKNKRLLKMHSMSRVVRLNIVKCQFFPHQSIDLTQFQKNIPAGFPVILTNYLYNL